MRKFRYLQSEVTTLADVDEAEALRNTLDAMTIVGLSQAEQVCSKLKKSYIKKKKKTLEALLKLEALYAGLSTAFDRVFSVFSVDKVLHASPP